MDRPFRGMGLPRNEGLSGARALALARAKALWMS
jgi:hypothetical protein